jgi:hypothetical protein
VFDDGDRVVHHADKHRPSCADRGHGTVDHSIPAEKSILGRVNSTPLDWVGVHWDDKHDGVHPPANLGPCTC